MEDEVIVVPHPIAEVPPNPLKVDKGKGVAIPDSLRQVEEPCETMAVEAARHFVHQ